MDLKLEKPIIFFDLETTGTNVAKDRIVEIALLKVNPDQTEESFCTRVNPEIPIPKDTSEIHGIYDKDIQDSPKLQDIADKIITFIGDADLAGYNSNKFDVPLLVEQLTRVGKTFDLKSRSTVDVQNIFHKKEQRTLSAAFQFYCDKELKDAHTALADTEATYEILKAQLDKYNDLENSITFLSDYSNNRKWKTLDLIGRIIEVKGKATINFGKHKNRTVFDVFQTDPGYYKWMMNGDFPQHTKTVLTELYNQFKSGGTSEKQQKKPKDITSDALEQLKNKFNQR